ncbi:DUF1735 and LamG domain-containing protein [Elizabethkingia anophelis]|uniref:DUF1735 and LamG domain-containing protein n=1 Tax=Elizabethkingia anophelis TaxID=1117645 RepID=UPI001627E457|nr:DUF1735 and LamG domain-containing protein [Elizabethkingia anophelis]MCT4323309.1 DUF1735 domain-containing protein [Elizabethkingia anophelis]HAY3536222.1 DUF1735 domain-containing protein [Elizabethkingia anophelis]HAY3548439.1 DUF1735 domain-containing protein [Elizabethkingia anophelis]HAY3593183.1 DUF1735 domain-containing protein [Elizabethkingia anophelis]
MKNIINIIGITLILFLSYSCNSDETNVSENAVYIEGNTGKDIIEASIESSEINIPISVRAAKSAEGQIEASVLINESEMEKYNKRNATEYTVLPASYYTLVDSRFTIEKGKYISNTGTLKIKNMTGLPTNKKYAIPVSISNVSGNTPLLEASKTVFVIIKRTITTRAASLTGNYFAVDFSKNNQNLKSLNQITFETRVFVNSFQPNSPFISSLMGIEENFLLRFGNVTIQPSQIEMAGGSTGVSGPSLSAGAWHHVAAVYDGSQLKIYVNGELVVTKDAVRTIDLTDPTGFYIGYSYGGRLLNGAVSEARVWSRALSRNELINGICGIDPKAPGLIGYWKFNESNAKVVQDLTGNGHDATAFRDITWVEGVKCSN